MAIPEKTSSLDWTKSYQLSPLSHDFLKQHPQIVDSLYTALPILHRIFGEELEIQLELTDERNFLFAYIWTDENAETALAKLNQFDTEYLLQLDAAIIEHLNFNLRYK